MLSVMARICLPLDSHASLIGLWELYEQLKIQGIFRRAGEDSDQGSVVQSIVSLTSSLVVKMLTVLVSTISNSQVFLLKKM